MITRSESDAAVQRIIDRRTRTADPDLEQASDAPLEAVAYVLACQRVSIEVLRADIVDALLVLEYARTNVPATPRELDRLELGLLTAGRTTGLSFGELASALGLRSRQAAEHRLLRLASAARGERRHETAERAARRTTDREFDWFTRYGRDLRQGAAALVARREVADEELAEMLADLAQTLASIPAAGAAGYLGRMQILAARLRLLLADLATYQSNPLGGDLDPVVARLTRLTAEHGDLISN
ncbi:hypothetical protein [Sphaerisporangium flaviroseum]|uniref:hypothetical protein n=1 Tax=Sphaerisporangium flaviroseum TaxID=509199 RepID=UPI0031EB85D4